MGEGLGWGHTCQGDIELYSISTPFAYTLVEKREANVGGRQVVRDRVLVLLALP
jgi:hypothetical protein